MSQDKLENDVLVEQHAAEAAKGERDKGKNCMFDMYGDCDGSGDDMIVGPEADE